MSGTVPHMEELTNLRSFSLSVLDTTVTLKAYIPNVMNV